MGKQKYCLKGHPFKCDLRDRISKGMLEQGDRNKLYFNVDSGFRAIEFQVVCAKW